MSLKTFLMLSIIIVAGPLGNVFLGKGMKQISSLSIWPPAHLLHTGVAVFSAPFIWLGILSLLTFYVCYMLVLSWADYSFVQPATSLAYGVIALLSYLILREKISLMRGAGIAVICLGVFVVSRTGMRTTHPEHS